jgi:isopentenyl diphosphate isomerase/L-lactate dehydrogenase-like FMN-dependent dehydrogenase
MSDPYNLEGYRQRARRKLPRAVFDFVDGGAEDEVTLRANREAFTSLRLVPQIHNDDSPTNVTTTLCGQPLSMPVVVGPTGAVGIVHPEGEAAEASAAARCGVIMIMSGVASYTIEEVAAAAEPKPWYQLYPWVSREFYGALIDRASEAGFRGLVVTIDTPTGGRRERDLANAFGHPPRLTRRNALGAVRHPRWTAGVLRHRRVVPKAFAEAGKPSLLGFVAEAKRSGRQITAALQRATWNELEWIRGRWTGPLGVKGIVHREDARRAVDLGAELIVVSNHGGRQLDGEISTLDALPEVVDAVAGCAEVVLDGGVRRGTDVLKALCLGARAVSVGRPCVYGLAVAGEAGVVGVLELLHHEIAVSLELLGQPDIGKLDRSYTQPIASEVRR